MRRSRVLAAIAVALMAGALLLRVPLPTGDGRVAPHADARAACADTTRLQIAGDAATAPPERHEVTAPDRRPDLGASDATNAPVLRVRLLGLVEDAPWTTTLDLSIAGTDENGDKVDHDAEAQPDAAGRATFVLPAWAATRMTKGRLRASDPAYLKLRVDWAGGQDLCEELLLHAHASATLTGRVVDEDGKPVKAEVFANVLADRVGFAGIHPSTRTRADGSWSLLVPASVRLKVVAQATCASSLLTAAVAVNADAGVEAGVPDLVLSRAAYVTGTVRWTDGQPVAAALVSLREGGEDAGASHDASAWTGDDGRFALPAMAGREADVELSSAQGLVPAGESRRAGPGKEVEFVVPRPVVLRPVRGGNEAEDAKLELGEGTITALYGHVSEGRQLVVPTRSFRARATDGQRRSAWRTIEPGDAGKTIDLELTNVLAEVRIHVEADLPLVAAEARWRRADGEEGSEYLSGPAGDQPFRVFVEPGSYHMTVAARWANDARSSAFLLPLECDFVAGGEPAVVHLFAAFGGRLELTATDADGVAIAGRCVIAGVTQTIAELGDTVGTTWSGVLPAGTYELHFHSAHHGTKHRTVTIEPRKLARIAVRF